MNTLEVTILIDVENFILDLPIKDQHKISGAINSLKDGKFECLYIKQLRGSIKELKVKKYRLLFFIKDGDVYFVRIFLKKTNKTPKNEIDIAEKFYKSLNNKNI